MANNTYIGIETIYRDVLLVNYGSIFQHYALRRVLNEFGYRVFRCEKDSFRNELLTIIFPIRLARLYVMSWFGLRSAPSVKFRRAGALRLKFIFDYWYLIGRMFERQRKGAVAYIAGGDSVWCRTVRSDYLLDKPAPARRISYAASSAWDKCSEDPKWCDCIREVARSFFAIGVRENAGAKVITNISPLSKVSVVIDPVMLLNKEELLGVVKRRQQQFLRPTLLYYAVNIWDSAALNLCVLEETAQRLRCDLKIVGIQGAEEYIPEKYAVRPSPREFLAMVRDAKYFVTNSFHGVVFSLVLQKEFAFIAQGAKRYGDQNCRQRELLERFSLKDRYLSSTPSAEEVQQVLLRSWNVSLVSDQLRAERERCKHWLKEALNESC